MKELLAQLNPAFDHRNRLGIMSVLVVNESLSYNALKDLLQLTDGNLASHIKALEAQEYISLTKEFVGRKPQTTYKATEAGRVALEHHLVILEQLIHQNHTKT
jgi:DNA-binding MarR family transcriptional regulator